MDYRILGNADVDKLNSILDTNKDYLNLNRGYLVHGDYTVEHIFTKNGHYTGNIDFSDTRIGNQLFDLAYFKISNRDYFLFLLEGYLSENPPTKTKRWKQDLHITALVVGIRIISSLIDDGTIKEGDRCGQINSFLAELLETP